MKQTAGHIPASIARKLTYQELELKYIDVKHDLAALRAENAKLREANELLLLAADALVQDFQIDEKIEYAALWIGDVWAYKDVTKLRDVIAANRAALA